LDELRSTGGMGPGLPLDLLKKKLEVLVDLNRDLRQAERDNGGPHLDEVLADASVKPGILPVLLLLAAGAGLIAMGLLLPLPGPVLSWVMVALGGGAGGAGVWGLASYFRGAGQARQALEKRQEIARKKDHLERLRSQLDDALADFNTELAGSEIAPVSDTVEATQRLQDISDLRERLKSLEAERKTDAAFLEREKGDLDRVGGEVREILERLGLDDGSAAEAEATRLLELSPGFVKAAQDREDSHREIDRLSKRLAETADLLHEDETPGMSENRLVQLIDVEKQRAGELANLTREISDIEAAIGVAHRGHDLQEALAASASAAAALTDVRQTNRESALGQMLLDRVELQHEKESRPQVLEQAAEYFRLFTGGRYELQMADQAEGRERFQARAEDSTQPLELQELSDGTRAQLLLAVKLAFMTVAEEGARPPIFLDDSLSSADPARFAAVAASLGRLAAEEERQIFYLTPNPADAAAFQRALAEKGLAAAHHIDLAEIRGVAGAADPSLLDPANLPANLMAPDPAGMGAADYAVELKTPQPNPWAPWGTLPVVFVLQDNLDLVRRLIDGNAATLGRFEINRDTLITAAVITADEAAMVVAGSDLWKAWLDGWRIGRARPVTREFLKDSAAVSGNYLEQVTAVLENCRWNGALLMEAIEAKKVKGFRVNKREQLRQELEDADLLAHGAALSSAT
jgi:exonuclease SbcC